MKWQPGDKATYKGETVTIESPAFYPGYMHVTRDQHPQRQVITVRTEKLHRPHDLTQRPQETKTTL